MVSASCCLPPRLSPCLVDLGSTLMARICARTHRGWRCLHFAVCAGLRARTPCTCKEKSVKCCSSDSDSLSSPFISDGSGVAQRAASTTLRASLRVPGLGCVTRHWAVDNAQKAPLGQTATHLHPSRDRSVMDKREMEQVGGQSTHRETEIAAGPVVHKCRSPSFLKRRELLVSFAVQAKCHITGRCGSALY